MEGGSYCLFLSLAKLLFDILLGAGEILADVQAVERNASGVEGQQNRRAQYATHKKQQSYVRFFPNA